MRKQTTISQFFAKSTCTSCGVKLQTIGLCPECKGDVRGTIASLTRQMRRVERKAERVVRTCSDCSGIRGAAQACVNVQCETLFRFTDSKAAFDSRSLCLQMINSLSF